MIWLISLSVHFTLSCIGGCACNTCWTRCCSASCNRWSSCNLTSWLRFVFVHVRSFFCVTVWLRLTVTLVGRFWSRCTYLRWVTCTRNHFMLCMPRRRLSSIYSSCYFLLFFIVSVDLLVITAILTFVRVIILFTFFINVCCFFNIFITALVRVTVVIVIHTCNISGRVM